MRPRIFLATGLLAAAALQPLVANRDIAPLASSLTPASDVDERPEWTALAAATGMTVGEASKVLADQQKFGALVGRWRKEFVDTFASSWIDYEPPAFEVNSSVRSRRLSERKQQPQASSTPFVCWSATGRPSTN